jgi:hypothetical protein
VEELLDDRGGSAAPRGLVERGEPGRAVDAWLVDVDPGQVEGLEDAGPVAGLGGVGQAVAALDDLGLEQPGVQDPGPGKALGHAATVLG